MSALTTTDPAALPQYEGRPVPWATRWSVEAIDAPLTIELTDDGEPFITYPDHQVNRDEFGYLWRREGAMRRGEPQYSQLNAYRQKASMRVPRCHVCGSKLPPGPIHWLLPEEAMGVSPEGDVTVISPPTCEGCVELARKLCPHLRANEGGDHLLVHDWQIWGVVGEVFILDGIQVVDRAKDIHLKYGSTYVSAGPRNFVVRQQVVALDDWEVIG